MESLLNNKIKYFKNQNPLYYEEFVNFKKNNLKYTDEIFPPNYCSLMSCDNQGKFYDKINGKDKSVKFIKKLKSNDKDINWERISNIPEYNVFYDKKYSYESIMQGTIGDCYLISALCALSQYPKLIINDNNISNSINIIHNSKYSEIGYYEIKLFVNGEYQIVIIDDYIPYYENLEDILFVKTNQNFYWVLLVEKAIAKVFGGYSNIENVPDSEDELNDINNTLLTKTNLVFQILTGFIPEYFYFDNEYNKEYHKNKILTKEEIYQKLYFDGLYQKNKDKNEILITTGSIGEEEGILEENYIPYSHSFSILDIKTLIIDDVKTGNKDEIKLLLLNNPWGKNIYNSQIFGKYKYNPNNKHLKDLNKYIQYNLNSKDGTFWIDFDTFYESFSYVSLCKIIPNSSIIIYKFDDDIYYEAPMIFNLIVKNDNTKFDISILLERNLYTLQDYTMFCYLIVNRYNDNNKIIESFSTYSYYEDINKMFLLDKGNYIIYVYIPEKYSYNRNEALNGSLKIVYNKEIIFDFIKFDKNFSYLFKSIKDILYLKNKNISSELTNYNDDIFSMKSNDIINGFNIIYLKNKVQKKFELDLTLTVSGYDILSPNVEKYSEKNYFINDNLDELDEKFYISIKKKRKSNINYKCSYTEGSNSIKSINNKIINDDSFYNFKELKFGENIKNKHNNIIIYEYFSPEYYKIDSKIYEKMKYYDSDNLIHDYKVLNNPDKAKRESRSINNDNNIHSFEAFSNKKYQNKTKSEENLHFFANKDNKKLSIKKESNNKYYLSNENNSGYKFTTINDKNKSNIFEKYDLENENNENIEDEKINNDEKGNENKNININNRVHEEINDAKYFYNYIDYMYKIEKKKNKNASYTEVMNKYKHVWSKMKDEEKIIYIYINLLEDEKIINFEELI